MSLKLRPKSVTLPDCGYTVQARPLSSNDLITINLRNLTSKGPEALKAQVEFFTDVIASWDAKMEDGSDAAVTVETVGEIPLTDLAFLTEQLMGKLLPANEGKGDGPSATPSKVGEAAS